jgi:hypothetical protein
VKTIWLIISIVRSTVTLAPAASSGTRRSASRRAPTNSPPICATGSRALTASRIQRKPIIVGNRGADAGGSTIRQAHAEKIICTK